MNRLLFCMFAEDIELLPDKLFTRLLEACEHAPERFAPMASELFAKMNKGGYFGADEIAWFNGGLFDGAEALPLDAAGVKKTLIAARMDWSSIEPSIFGTMFERGLDPAKRSQLGAHYTDAGKIMKIIEPVILRPLRQEWDETKAQIEPALEKANNTKSKGARTKGMQKAQSLLGAYLDRLRNVRVLDPACGSGNFLYLALMHLKDLEHLVLLEAEAMGLGMQLPQLGPEVVKGIEINAYAAELARVTVWIGQIQWMIKHGFSASRKPILESLDTIENRDALIESRPCTTEDTESTEERRVKEAVWPEAEFIVGNPPFLGGSKILRELGKAYTQTLRNLYQGRVPGSADLVTYWFAKAGKKIVMGQSKRAGFVSTQSIRGGANRTVLENILEDMPIFEAWRDEPWIVNGAAVRVSLIGFGHGEDRVRLDNIEVPVINADLTAQSFDLSQAMRLDSNRHISFQGSQKIGPFDIPGDLARDMLNMPSNPNGCLNTDVIRPSWNGLDVTRRPRDVWMIDFGCNMSEADASLFEAPFEYVVEHVKQIREKNNREAYRKYWWRHGEPRVAMRSAIQGLARYIATPEVAKHRIFVWMHASILPDKKLMVIARDDDATFGILQSRVHEVWSLAMCTWHGKGNDPRYTPTTCFETFPFPKGFPLHPPTPFSIKDFNEIGEIARRLDILRQKWLNPPEWIERIPEVVEGYPGRVVPKPSHEADLKKRTLTNLYNTRPAWLDNIHKELDAAVATGYGWDDYTPDMSDEEILARLFELNQEGSR